MFEELMKIITKPALFESFDTAALWAHPHVSEKMLEVHLDSANELASRPAAQIDAMTAWLSQRIDMSGKSLTDLGCGPGLYAQRFQQAGARVVGIDLSESSIAYANGLEIPQSDFRIGNYLQCPLPPSDIVTLIYGDVCAIPPSDRSNLFHRVHAALRPGGTFILDASPESCFETYDEKVTVAKEMDAGFWANTPYIGIKASFLYPEQMTILDRYVIVERSQTRWVHNWLQFLAPTTLSRELAAAGFAVGEPLDPLSGSRWSDEETMYCLIARK